jgi:putative MFS transporter
MTLLAAGHGGALVFLLALRLPETTRWLQRHAREPSASRFDRTAGGSGFATRLALLLTLQMLLPLAVVGFTTLSGVVMRQRSIDLHGSLLYLAVAGIGAPLGSLTASLFVDRIARQRLYAGGCLAVGVLGMAFAEAKSVRAAMAVGGAFLFTLTIVVNTLSVYGPEMFGTARRGFATGLGYAAFRAVAALVPLLLLPLLLSHGAVPAFAVMAGAMVVSAALVLVFGPRGTAGRILE